MTPSTLSRVSHLTPPPPTRRLLIERALEDSRATVLKREFLVLPDAYRVMLRALDYGCVYYWYNDLTVIPTHPHLTQFMFPITPLELHEGVLIGKERILTNRSGLFGLGDDSRHVVHVFDEEGREVKDVKAPTITRGGKTFTELRIAEGWNAAIVTKE